MKRGWLPVRLLTCVLLCGIITLPAMAATQADTLTLFVLDGPALTATRDRAVQGDEPVLRAIADLRAQANSLLDAGPWSVMDKTVTPPSGNKHDYLSQAPYWWPNPDTADGFPYIERDGQNNPERDALDRLPLSAMCDAVSILSTAWFYTSEPQYARRAAFVLRTWFLDEATRMNPHLNYAQGIPGLATGTFWGIIESHSFTPLMDAITLLRTSTEWSPEDQRGMETWFGQYLDWLLTSIPGMAESAAANNHGTWYDVQVVSMARFCGRDDIAKQTLEHSLERMETQFDAEGNQPHELRRTKPLSYCAFNLRAWFDLACHAKPLGVDLWNHKASDDQGLRLALDAVLPFFLGEQSLDKPDIVPLSLDQVAQLLRRAYLAWGDEVYEHRLQDLANRLDPAVMRRIGLLWPLPPNASS